MVTKRSRSGVAVAGGREPMAIAATLGGKVRAGRRARHLTLAGLARRVGISTTRLSEIERGLGARAPLETWIALGIALDRPLAIDLSRPDRIATVWVDRASATNRAILDRYPHILDATFAGSSRAWVAALTQGGQPPDEPGIVWFDPTSASLRERRRATIAP